MFDESPKRKKEEDPLEELKMQYIDRFQLPHVVGTTDLMPARNDEECESFRKAEGQAGMSLGFSKAMANIYRKAPEYERKRDAFVVDLNTQLYAWIKPFAPAR